MSTQCLLRCVITGEKKGCFSVAAAGVVPEGDESVEERVEG